MKHASVLLAAFFVTVLIHADSRQPRFITFTAKEKSGIYLRNLKISEVRLLVDNQPVRVSYLGYKNVETPDRTLYREHAAVGEDQPDRPDPISASLRVF
jgi:hypothetical protein